MPITPTSLCHVTNAHFHADGRSVILVSRDSADRGDHLSPLITLQLNFLLMCVRVRACAWLSAWLAAVAISRHRRLRQVLRHHSQQVRRRRRRLSRLYRRRQPPPPSASSSSRRRQQVRPAWRRPTTRWRTCERRSPEFSAICKYVLVAICRWNYLRIWTIVWTILRNFHVHNVCKYQLYRPSHRRTLWLPVSTVLLPLVLVFAGSVKRAATETSIDSSEWLDSCWLLVTGVYIIDGLLSWTCLVYCLALSSHLFLLLISTWSFDDSNG